MANDNTANTGNTMTNLNGLTKEEANDSVMNDIFYAAACYIVRHRNDNDNPLLVVTHDDIVSEFPELNNEPYATEIIWNEFTYSFVNTRWYETHQWFRDLDGNIGRDDTYMRRTDLPKNEKWNIQPIMQ